jgi:hypothetical protein
MLKNKSIIMTFALGETDEQSPSLIEAFEKSDQ